MKKSYYIHTRLAGKEYEDTDMMGTVIKVTGDDETIHEKYRLLQEAADKGTMVRFADGEMYVFASVGKYYEVKV